MDRDYQVRVKFYQAFDASFVSQFVSKLLGLSEVERRGHQSLLGEGFHFQSFDLLVNGFPMAVNIAKESFLAAGDLRVSRWKADLEKVRALEGIDLIPPLEILSFSRGLAVVLPKGDQLSKTLEKRAEAMLLEMARALGHAGLALNDYPQLRQTFGVPFIIDWSDLQPVT